MRVCAGEAFCHPISLTEGSAAVEKVICASYRAVGSTWAFWLSIADLEGLWVGLMNCLPVDF